MMKVAVENQADGCEELGFLGNYVGNHEMNNHDSESKRKIAGQMHSSKMR